MHHFINYHIFKITKSGKSLKNHLYFRKIHELYIKKTSEDDKTYIGLPRIMFSAAKLNGLALR